LFQGGVAQFVRKGPIEPCISYPLDVVGDCAAADAAAEPDLTVAAVEFVLRRNTSRILRIDNLLPGLKPSLIKSTQKGSLYHVVLCVATFENGGRNALESVTGMKWNGWPEWNGIHGRDRLEYAP
jgi:hypothetical protein